MNEPKYLPIMKGEENKLTKLKVVGVFYSKWADRSLSGNLDINLSKQANRQSPSVPFSSSSSSSSSSLLLPRFLSSDIHH